MKNITKKWSTLVAHPLSSIALVALLALLLMIPWPIGLPVRLLLDMNDSKILKQLSWDQVLLQPSGGLVFTNLELTPIAGMKVQTPLARIRFSWSQLLFLHTRIHDIDTKDIRIEWNLPALSSEQGLDYAAPTEDHIGQTKKILDDLRNIIATGGITIKSTQWTLMINNDSLALLSPTFQAIPEDSSWFVRIASATVIRKPWPLPTSFKAALLLSDSAMHVTRLDACWDGGCLSGFGTLGMDNALSKLTLVMDGIPLDPFGELALPKNAHWKGSAQGKFKWQGRIAHPDSWNAEGFVNIHKVEFLHWPFQRESTFSNFVPELNEKISVSRIDIPVFKLQAGKVKIDSLYMESNEMDAVARGTWTFPERLDFRLNGSIHKDLYKRLPRLTRLALPKTEDGGGFFKASLSGTFAWQAIIPDSEHYGTAFRNLFK